MLAHAHVCDMFTYTNTIDVYMILCVYMYIVLKLKKLHFSFKRDYATIHTGTEFAKTDKEGKIHTQKRKIQTQKNIFQPT